MNIYIYCLLLAILHQYQHKLASGHLRPLYPDTDSEEDESEKGGAPKILPLLRPSPPNPDNNRAPPTNRRYPDQQHFWQPPPPTATQHYPTDKPALINVTVVDSVATASAYSSGSYDDGSSSTFVPLIRNSSTEFVRNSSATPTSSSVQYCEPEVFEHDYIIVENLTHPTTNIWKRARVGERAGLREVCLQSNGLPLTRLCRYNKQEQRAEWEDISAWPRVSCLRHARECILSDKLNRLHERLLDGQALDDEVTKRREVTGQLYKMLRETNFKLLPADVHLTSQILHEVAVASQDPELSVDMVSICDRLMTSDPHVLRISANLNATNSILDTFEHYMDAMSARQVPNESCASTSTTTIVSRPSEETSEDVASGYTNAVEEVKMGHLGIRAHISKNISVFFVNPSCANISGIAVYAPTAKQEPGTNATHALLNATVANFCYRFINMNESVSSLMQEPGLQVAGYLPTRLWERVRTTLLSEGKLPLVVLKVYGHDALFVDPALIHTRKPFSKILSISIPGYRQTFPEPLPFLLRNRFDYMDPSLIAQPGTGCGYWNYTTWVNNGVQTDIEDLLKQSVIECRTQHLTQFSFLLGGTYKQVDISNDVLITPIHMRALDIISLVGCSLSLVGLLGIWITAVMFKSWRALASTKVLLNLCVALTLQIVLFVFVNTEDMSAELVEDRLYINCIVLGAFMQYSILVLFAWMLIIAMLQFQRYVTVIGIERPKRYILKSCLVAWGVPLIPTILVVCIDPKTYIPSEYELQTNTGICYPSGLSLTLGIVVPISIVVVANLTIFIYVFYSISHTLNQAMQRNEKKMIIKQIRLSVLLFFLLGISWIFGIFAYMQAGIIFSYLFCLTATMQGFVLFIYFVLIDEMPRNAWLNLLYPYRKKKSSKRATELQSMTTSTGLESGSCSRDAIPRERRSENINGHSTPKSPVGGAGQAEM
ncbi:uncharacterized protein LOC118737585 [Rhagoletis pomonella]|uniref:uncharacterized protein LOC118737585 n=1 Tax=Rhagoletis pomonella TaxID=28610 RepID=UPI001782915C|nr:uncharacterized protein LOC118737585 [Rhagoletis pomonella]